MSCPERVKMARFILHMCIIFKRLPTQILISAVNGWNRKPSDVRQTITDHSAV